MYLQGGCVRGRWPIYIGRYFFDDYAPSAKSASERHQKSPVGWGYGVMGVGREDDEWTFWEQLLELDSDGSSFPREGKVGNARNAMTGKHWTFPRDVGYMRFFMTAFGSGECDDNWIVEVQKAPQGAQVEIVGK